jgi:hypothetical protein
LSPGYQRFHTYCAETGIEDEDYINNPITLHETTMISDNESDNDSKEQSDDESDENDPDNGDIGQDDQCKNIEVRVNVVTNEHAQPTGGNAGVPPTGMCQKSLISDTLRFLQTKDHNFCLSSKNNNIN